MSSHFLDTQIDYFFIFSEDLNTPFVIIIGDTFYRRHYIKILDSEIQSKQRSISGILN